MAELPDRISARTDASPAIPAAHAADHTEIADAINALISAVADLQGTNRFTVTASPGSRTAGAGSTATYTVTVAMTAGADQTVELSCEDLPDGVTASWSPGTVTGDGSSTLTLTISGSAEPATTTFTIVGQGNITSASTTADLTVSSSTDDFAVTLSPTTRSVSPGSAVDFTVGVRTTNGADQAVTLSASGLPYGVTASWSDSTITSADPETTTTLTLTAAADAHNTLDPGVGKCLTGFYVSGNDGADVTAWETANGTQFAVVKCYVDMGPNLIGASHVALAKAGKVLQVNVSNVLFNSTAKYPGLPTPGFDETAADGHKGFTWPQISSGDCDPWIQALGEQIRDDLGGAPVLLTIITHEPDLIFSAESTGDPADKKASGGSSQFVAAAQHFVDYLRNGSNFGGNAPTNISFVLVVSGGTTQSTALGQCGTTSSSTTVVLDSGTNMAAFAVGNHVRIGTATVKDSIVADRTITAVNTGAKTITISGGAISTTSANYVYTADGYVPDHYLTALWPGDDRVDWIAWNPFVTTPATQTASAKFQIFRDKIRSAEVFGSAAAALPLMLSEWGAKSGDPARPAWLAGVDDALVAHDIRCAIYWNSDQNSTRAFKLTDSASAAAFATLNNGPVFVRSALTPGSFTVTAVGAVTRSTTGKLTITPGGVIPTITLGTYRTAGKVDLELPNYAGGGLRWNELSGLARCNSRSGKWMWTHGDDGSAWVFVVNPGALGSTATIRPSSTPPGVVQVTLAGGSFTSPEEATAGPDKLAGGARRIMVCDTGNNARSTSRTYQVAVFPDQATTSITASWRTFQFRQAGGGGSARYPDVEASELDRDGNLLMLAKYDDRSYYGEGTGLRDLAKHAIYVLDWNAYSSPYRAVYSGYDLVATWTDPTGATIRLLPVAMALHPSLPIMSVLLYDSRGGANQVRKEIRHFYRSPGLSWPQALAQTSSPGRQITALPNGGSPGYVMQDVEGLVWAEDGSGLWLCQDNAITDTKGNAAPANMYWVPATVA